MEYEGYVINSASQQLTEAGEWTLRVSITKHRDSQGVTNEKLFDTTNTFASKEEADAQSVKFGQKIIDGEVDNCNVNDL